MASMGDDDSDTSAEVMRSLLHAYDVGVEAEDAIGAIAAPPVVPQSTSWGALGSVAARMKRGVSASAGPDQVRRVCDQLEVFALALSEFLGQTDDYALGIQTSDRAEWAKRMWANNKNAAGVYNEVRGAMATLHSYRINGIPDGVPLDWEP
jgi:hypothetical protein